MAPKTILLIESEPELRKVLRTILERAGYLVRVRADPGERIEDPDGLEQVDLILTCLEMAPQGGLETLERLCQLNPRPPVVVVSGAGEERLCRAAEAGAIRVIRKPFRRQVLLRTLEEVLSPPRHQTH